MASDVDTTLIGRRAVCMSAGRAGLARPRKSVVVVWTGYQLLLTQPPLFGEAAATQERLVEPSS
jgi:hypothetical protein